MHKAFDIESCTGKSVTKREVEGLQRPDCIKAIKWLAADMIQ